MIAYYVRVSTEEQAQKGTSIEDQLRRNKLYLNQQFDKGNITINKNSQKEYIDRGVSGEIINRPALNKLRQDASEGKLTVVICLDPDRLSRKLMHQLYITEELENCGIKLMFVNGEYQNSPEGNLFYSLRGAVSEFEKAKIFERMRRGRLSKAREGKILRDYNIYGYNYNRNNRQLEINDEEATIVKLIFNLFIKPNTRTQGINGIANYLTNRKIPTKKGKTVWHRQVIKQILQNPTYTGVFYHNKWEIEKSKENLISNEQVYKKNVLRDKKQWIPVKCPAIIDHVSFHKAQWLLENTKNRWNNTNKKMYLLSGLIKCGKCYNSLTGRKVKDWGKVDYIYTDKKNNSNKYKGCGLNIKCEDLDSIIVKWLFYELRKYQNIENYLFGNFEERVQNLKREHNLNSEELDKIKSQRNSIVTLLSKKLISEQEAERYLLDLKEKEQVINQEQQTISYEVTEINQLRQDPVNLSAYLKNTMDSWHYKENLIESRELLRMIVKEIIVSSESIKVVTF